MSSGVFGSRTYTPESQPIPPRTRKPSQRELSAWARKDYMSMSEIFRMERFLSGMSFEEANAVINIPLEERKRILNEYPIKRDKKECRYMGDLDEVWAVMAQKFPESSAKYKNYRACQYALKYGAVEPCAWMPAKECTK